MPVINACNRNVLNHPNSVPNSLVKRPFPGQVNPNTNSLIEISFFVNINHAALYTCNASGKLLDISESSRIVSAICNFSLM